MHWSNECAMANRIIKNAWYSIDFDFTAMNEFFFLTNEWKMSHYAWHDIEFDFTGIFLGENKWMKNVHSHVRLFSLIITMQPHA
jgi:hypothetical protein